VLAGEEVELVLTDGVEGIPAGASFEASGGDRREVSQTRLSGLVRLV
jgi:hypothetical protein